jgi:hypothetical protein
MAILRRGDVVGATRRLKPAEARAGAVGMILSGAVAEGALGKRAVVRSNLAGGPALQRSSHDLSPPCLGARHCTSCGHHSRPRSCRSIGAAGSTGEVCEQHPKRQAGPGSLRSAQRRRQLSAGVPLPSTARAVPERCRRLVWRGAGPCEPHAHASYQPDEPNESDYPNESDAPHAYESNDPDKSNDHDESRQ